MRDVTVANRILVLDSYSDVEVSEIAVTAGNTALPRTTSVEFLELIPKRTLTSKLSINAGVLHGFLYTKGSLNTDDMEIKDSLQIDAYLPVLGLDYYLSNHWAFSSFALFPAYSAVEQRGDTGDARLSQVSQLGRKKEKRYLYFASLTHSWDVFNLEFGLMGGFKAVPYLSLYWRL